VDVLKKYEQIVIITDEIYEKLTYTEVKHFSIGSVAELATRVITINGMSKAFAMTGWRIGYACCPSPQPSIPSPVIKGMATLQGQMTSNITSFSYAAIVEAMTNSAESVEKMRRKFAERAELIHGKITAMPGVKCPKPTGAFYVFPDVSAHFGKSSPNGKKIASALTFAEALLEDAKVAVVPGEDFGEIARNHVRLSFACSEQNITEGCKRIDGWLRQLK
jgi:aspartate aminotransferase